MGVVLDDAWFPEILNARQVGTMMAMTYRELGRGALPELSCPLRPAQGEEAFKDYSRGMKMKLAIAVALSPPAGGCCCWTRPRRAWTPSSGTRCWRSSGSSPEAEDHAILISSHILSDLEKLCDYIAFLHQGKLLFCRGEGPPAGDLRPLCGHPAAGGGAGGGRRPCPGGQRLRRRPGHRPPGCRCPPALPLEKPTVEDIILAMVRKEQKR